MVVTLEVPLCPRESLVLAKIATYSSHRCCCLLLYCRNMSESYLAARMTELP